MAKGHGPAMDIEPFRIQSQFLDHCHGHNRKSLVHLIQVYLADIHFQFLQKSRDRLDWRDSEPFWSDCFLSIP
jgi:hypothetical protein